jgi:hypothetical protein
VFLPRPRYPCSTGKNAEQIADLIFDRFFILVFEGERDPLFQEAPVAFAEAVHSDPDRPFAHAETHRQILVVVVTSSLAMDISQCVEHLAFAFTGEEGCWLF